MSNTTNESSDIPQGLKTFRKGRPRKKNRQHYAYEKIDGRESDRLATAAYNLLKIKEPEQVSDARLNYFSSKTLTSLAVTVCSKPNSENGIHFKTYDPQPGTMDDPLMGTLNRNMACKTCGQNQLTCTGHLGRIDMSSSPIVNPIRKVVLVQILNSFSIGSGRPNWSDEHWMEARHLPLYGKLKYLSAKCYAMNQGDRQKLGHTYKKCRYAVGPKDSKRERSFNDRKGDGDVYKAFYSICREYDDISKDTTDGMIPNSIDKPHLVIQDFKEHISAIEKNSQKELRMLGFHPNNDGFIELSGYILEQLPVIPPCARYYSEFDGVKEPSPLTVSYQNIIKNLAKVPNNINNDYINVMNDIYYYVKGLYTNITELVKGKDGYIRGFTMSKRNDFSGRSVLNPYNTLKFGYVAYPSIMRKFHTIPVKLTDFNYTQMTEFLKNNQVIRVIGGPNSPKPSKIITVTKQFLNVYTPQIGDTFELQGQDGDETMFNRQPTLDKYAIMGYKAHYVEDWNYLCIGLLSPYNTPHNSDYDGDQGNKLKIQTLHGRSEIRQFVGVENCMMNTNSNKPTMGMVYNSVTSAYLMTSSDEEISPKYWEYFFSFLQSRDDVDSLKERLDLNGMPEYTGKALFSALLPDDFHYDRRRNENDTQSVYIRNGILVQGIITSKDIGPSPNSIFHYMWKEYDRERMTRFFTEAQHILDEYLEYYGFSIGMKSVLMEDHHRIEAIVAQTIEMSKAKISALGLDREDETFLEKEIRESKVSGYVNTVSRIGVTIGNNVLPKFNAIRVMNTSGAKGKDTNTAQIIGALGQQYILGQRPKLEITKGTRYLPYYEPNSTDIESRGFIKESFLTGANPGGFIAHMAASRVGLMDTALKTGEIGYLHHRIVKVTEDVTINYDGSIRNTDGKILSYSYDGGFSTAAIIKTKNDATGEVLSFTDVKATAAKLDAQLDVGK